MKAYLQFNLPEDQSELEAASNAGRFESCLWEIQAMIRNRKKHCDLQDETKIILDEIWEILNDHDALT